MNTRLKMVILGVGATLSLLTAAPAAASHDHHMETPGTCVEDIARGQTAKAEGDGGYHMFHDNVHKGMPGTKAFANPNNPVSVDKTTDTSSCAS